MTIPMMDEMTRGYLDGIDPNCPEPSENRSYSYRHGFQNGRDDLNHAPRATAARLREQADEAIKLDEEVFEWTPPSISGADT